MYRKRGISDYYAQINAGRRTARVRVVVVNDTMVEVCCSVVITNGVENDDGLVMEVLDGVKTEVTGKRYGLPERKWPEVPCDGWNSVLTTRFLKVALATSRDSVLV